MLKRSYMAAFLLACGLCLPALPDLCAQRRGSVAEALLQISRGDLSAADLTLESVLAQDPKNADAWFELGNLQGQLHQFEAAEASLRRAVALAPGNARAHYTLGLSLIADPKNKLDWLDAIAEFRAALYLQPSYADALTYLGAGLAATGKPEEAVTTLKQAVAANPGLATAQFNLALVLEAVSRDTEAAAAYRKAIALRSPYPEASSALGKLLARTGDFAGAEPELRTALRTNPDLQDAHQGLGRVLRSTHRPAEAAIEFAQSVALGQREPDGVAASQLSNAALQRATEGKLAAAVEMLRRAILLRPDYGVPHINLGLLLADTGDLAGAVRELSIAVSLMPAQGRPYFDLGRVLLLENKQAEAASCLRWAAQLLPADPRIAAELRKLPPEGAAGPHARPDFGAQAETPKSHAAFAAELHQAGDSAGEAGELLHALSLAPAMVAERLQLAAAYRLLNDARKADLEDRKVLLVEPGNAEATAALQRGRSPSPATKR